MNLISFKRIPLAALVMFWCAIFLMLSGMGPPGPPAPITFAGVTDAAFGQIDFVAGANGNIDLGTDGTIVYGAGYSGSGVGTAGAFTINGERNNTVDISCATTATLANSAGATMPISAVEIAQDQGGGPGAFGTATACAGIGTTVLSHKIKNNSSQNRFVVGMRIDGSGGVPTGPGNYSTTNTGGTAAVFDVVYQ